MSSSTDPSLQLFICYTGGMKKLVKYTLYFEYEDPYWDTHVDKDGTAEEHLRYFIEEHNCHSNFLNDITKSMELAGDDVCGAGIAKVIEPSDVPSDIQPYVITKEFTTPPHPVKQQ